MRESPDLDESTWHTQVDLGRCLVDQGIAPVIRWCHAWGISTLASCEGFEREHAYILFESPTDLERFFEMVSHLASRAQAGELSDHILGKDIPRMRGSRAWRYEVIPSAAALAGTPGSGLCAVVQFPACDLSALSTLLPRP